MAKSLEEKVMTDVDNSVVEASVKTVGNVDISRVIDKVRTLQVDLDDFERTVRVLSDVSLVNKAITSAASDTRSIQEISQHGSTMKRVMEFIVRKSVPFDRDTFTTMANYKAFVLSEV